MRRTRWTLLAAILAVGFAAIAAMAAQTQTAAGRPPGTNYQGPAFTFNIQASTWSSSAGRPKIPLQPTTWPPFKGHQLHR